MCRSAGSMLRLDPQGTFHAYGVLSAATLLLLFFGCVGKRGHSGEGIDSGTPRRLTVWAASDAHLDVDLERGRRSLGDAISDSEEGGDEGGAAFDWDIMLHLGDVVGGGRPPSEEAGRAVIDQLSTLRRHRREQIYFVLGNHDASPGQAWFRRWIDPAGRNTSISGVHSDRRPYRIAGTWERYSFQVGNILFLMMSDRNDLEPPVGRGQAGRGYAAGSVTEETFAWWRNQVERNQDKVIVTAHHHVLQDTTVASGLNQGSEGLYHGFAGVSIGGTGDRSSDAMDGVSFLYFVGDTPGTRRFEKYLERNPGAIDLWLGGHTHTHPDDTYGGKTHIERRWKVTFINVAALTRFHRLKRVPMSRTLTFTEGTSSVRVRCYLHTSDYAPEGWYGAVERNVPLNRRVRLP